MSEMKDPPDTSWIQMETIRDGGFNAYAVALVGVNIIMLAAAFVLLWR